MGMVGGVEPVASGNAMPNRNNSTGIISAATMPPELNGSQRKGSADRGGGVMCHRSTTQATIADSTTQAR